MKVPLLKKNKQAISQEEITRQKREKTAQEWIPVADINRSIIYRKDTILVSMIRILPQNLELLSDTEQKNKVEALAEQLNGENKAMQFFCIGRPVDLNNYLDWLQDKARIEQDFTRRKLLKKFIKQASLTASSGETMERRFYLILTSTVEKNAEIELGNRTAELRDKLGRAGLSVDVCNDDELLAVLALFANPVQASFERNELELSLAPLLDV
jgi:hypothetical protein